MAAQTSNIRMKSTAAARMSSAGSISRRRELPCGKILFDRGLTELAQPYLIRARDHDVCLPRATAP